MKAFYYIAAASVIAAAIVLATTVEATPAMDRGGYKAGVIAEARQYATEARILELEQKLKTLVAKYESSMVAILDSGLEMQHEIDLAKEKISKLEVELAKTIERQRNIGWRKK